jgi:hypothetical protein
MSNVALLVVRLPPLSVLSALELGIDELLQVLRSNKSKTRDLNSGKKPL